MLGDLLYQLGSILGSLGGLVTGQAGTAFDEGGREVAVYDTETGEVHEAGAADGSDGVDAAQAMVGALTAWLVARLLRPRDVSWPRVVLAGIAATALADLVGRKLEDDHDASTGTPYAEDPEELMARFTAGVAVAAGYASILYPRFPGSPLFRGLTFGALELAAAPRGGLVALASATPGVRYPLQALALPVDEDAGALSHVAFGLGLGLFYRYGAARHDDEDED